MKSNSRQDKSLLLKTAQAVVEKLWQRTDGTSLHPRWPGVVSKVNTGGWRGKIGNLGNGQPGLQIWFDRFTGYASRRFNFCFFLGSKTRMRQFAKRASKYLPLHKRLTNNDTEDDNFTMLSKRLRRDEFGAAILEEYEI